MFNKDYRFQVATCNVIPTTIRRLPFAKKKVEAEKEDAKW
jgi:hypothetical protein